MNDIKWTTEFPIVEGFYWVRNLEFKYRPEARESVIHPAPQVAELAEFNRGYEMYLTGSEVGVRPDMVISAEWYGPLQPPA